ncbi:hypothetical protein FBUS_06520 [Fasciolopsis buskii]|uniref:AVL9/DENND6 domain-containing protein n=1 Tax=Fasciolopsis buskii TaxID=27845 RepID=A0A8E0RVY6_9TREM|nr:hypothetical protein FBUS_06520 [Fasciolopsis buski]
MEIGDKLATTSLQPLFSLIAHRLSSVAETLFEDGQFSPERLQAIYTDMEDYVSVVFTNPTTYQDALAFHLSTSNFLRVYGRDALVCFKLVLLERRVLFDGESAGWMCTWILALLSLFPGNYYMISDTLIHVYRNHSVLDTFMVLFLAVPVHKIHDYLFIQVDDHTASYI